MTAAEKHKRRSELSKTEREFDRILSMCDSQSQMDRIRGRGLEKAFRARFTEEQMNAMFERIKDL